MSKANLEQILDRKRKGKLDKFEVSEFKSKYFDDPIEIRKIPLKKFMAIVETIDTEDQVDVMNEVIFECCTMFKSASSDTLNELMEAFEVFEPLDLPSAVFCDDITELSELFMTISDLYGVETQELADDIKN